jgi:hypothetical protein
MGSLGCMGGLFCYYSRCAGLSRDGIAPIVGTWYNRRSLIAPIKKLVAILKNDIANDFVSPNIPFFWFYSGKQFNSIFAKNLNHFSYLFWFFRMS